MTGEVASITVGRPFLTMDAVDYAKYLLKTPLQRWFIDVKTRK